METGSQSSNSFIPHHQCLPHRENLTRLIDYGDVLGGDEINNLVNPVNPSYLVKRPTIVTKLPPIFKSTNSERPTSTHSIPMDSIALNTTTAINTNHRSSVYGLSTPSSGSSSPSLLSHLSVASFDDISDPWKGYADPNNNCDNILTNLQSPTLKIRLLEKNLQFMKEQHKMILNCLHNQIEELSRKNRDLQFKLIVNNLYPDNLEGSSAKLNSVISEELGKGSLPLEVINHLNNLEIEVGRLRLALGEALKMNASLRNRLMLKSTIKSNPASQLKETESPSQLVQQYKQASSKVESFRETWRAINSAKMNPTNSFLPEIK